jgi:hypothetical protein
MLRKAMREPEREREREREEEPLMCRQALCSRGTSFRRSKQSLNRALIETY